MSADALGIYDLVEKCWSPLLLEALALSPNRFPDPLPPGELLGGVTRLAAAETGLVEGLPIFAGGGDGHYAGLGTNCTVPNRAYVNLGTAVVSGVWSPAYRYSRAWRTLLAAQGEGYIYESVLRSGRFSSTGLSTNLYRKAATIRLCSAAWTRRRKKSRSAATAC